MGVGIAYVFAASGAGVTLVELDEARTQRALAALGHQFTVSVERGKIDAPAAASANARIKTAGAIGDLAPGLDLIVEAVPESIDLKRRVLRAAAARDPRLLASNTSGLSINTLAEGLPAPERFLGLHFFNPVWAMSLVEIVLGMRTGRAAADAAIAACRQAGKETILVHDVPGFASSRLGVTLGLEAMRMVEAGVASAADIDRAMELGYRHPMGPLKLSDLVGLDVRLDIARYLEGAHGARFAPPGILVDLVAAGNLGKKTGRGFYDWSSGIPLEIPGRPAPASGAL